LCKDPVRADAIAEQLIGGALRLAADSSASSLHVLFPATADRAHFVRNGFLERKGCQFHWHNDGYVDFDDFLARFSSAKRKKARRERRRIAEGGIHFEHLRGDEPNRSDWDAIHRFYSRTFLRRGRAPYLNREFFDEISATMPESLLIILARYEGQPIATAICFRSADTLYGRYWGSLADFHSLHFEACYYQGIEYCIANGLRHFEPGTQGEHKISRGFSPHATWSYHWLGNHAFREAIERYLTQETTHVDAYIGDLQEHVPYRRDSEPSPPQ
jgi:predicted N-acyltransferase